MQPSRSAGESVCFAVTAEDDLFTFQIVLFTLNDLFGCFVAQFSQHDELIINRGMFNVLIDHLVALY